MRTKDEADKNKVKMVLAEEVTFFNKGAILRELESIKEGTHLVLDVRRTRFLDHDIIEILDDFSEKAEKRNIHVTLKSERGIAENPKSYIEFFQLDKKKVAV